MVQGLGQKGHVVGWVWRRSGQLWPALGVGMRKDS